jgi:hypothetical protein
LSGQKTQPHGPTATSKGQCQRCWLPHRACRDHILNITTKLAGLDPIDTPHTREEHADALLNARQMCGTFSNSSQLTARLLEFQATQAVQRPKKTIQDVKTRWWSTYSMINRLLLLKPYISYLCSQPDVEVTNLNDAQWKLLGDIVIILEPLMLAQKLLEGDICDAQPSCVNYRGPT